MCKYMDLTINEADAVGRLAVIETWWRRLVVDRKQLVGLIVH